MNSYNPVFIELATMSFGQSFQITPLKLLRAASEVINGGTLVTPHFGIKTLDEEGNVVKEFTYGKYMASFIGYAPANDPEVIAICIIDEPVGIYYGGTIAAPVIADIYSNILPYLEIEKSESLPQNDWLMLPKILY